MTPVTSPILFLVFNRPETTKVVFNTIRLAKPVKLYVAADGARFGKNGEKEQVAKVRDIVSRIDWDCEVKTLFRDNNLGCKMAVSSAISWFFEHEEEGIILEDDCLPDQSFFPYCQQLLEKYRHDTRIMAISGDNFQRGNKHTDYSYYFSHYNHVWGWASWRRAWECYDLELLNWPELKETDFLDTISGSSKPFVSYWRNIFDTCYDGLIDTWDYPWTFSCWIQSGLTVLPSVNLVSNIGFINNSTHTHEKSPLADLARDELSFPLSHPPYLIRSFLADRYTDLFVFNIHSSFLETEQNIVHKTFKFVKKSICSRLFGS